MYGRGYSKVTVGIPIIYETQTQNKAIHRLHFEGAIYNSKIDVIPISSSELSKEIFNHHQFLRRRFKMDRCNKIGNVKSLYYNAIIALPNTFWTFVEAFKLVIEKLYCYVALIYSRYLRIQLPKIFIEHWRHVSNLKTCRHW